MILRKLTIIEKIRDIFCDIDRDINKKITNLNIFSSNSSNIKSSFSKINSFLIFIEIFIFKFVRVRDRLKIRFKNSNDTN